jgi:pentatricopeptide repeat protein
MYNLLIKGYASSIPPQPEAARATLERIIAAGLTPSIASLTSVMDAFCEANDVDAAAALATHFSEVHGLGLTEPVYNVLIKGYARCRCKRSTGVCHCVVCTCCQPNAGMKILEQMAVRGLVPDAVTINTLIDAHCNAGQIPQAWLLLESICIGGGGLANRQGAAGRVKIPAGAVQPNLTGFRTAFRAMARHVSDHRFIRPDRRRRDGEEAPAAAVEASGPRALPREVLLRMLADGLGLLLTTLGPKNDESLSATLHTLGRALVPNWQAPAGPVMSETDLVRLKDEADAALHMSACIPEGLVSSPRDAGTYPSGAPPRYLYRPSSSQPDVVSQPVPHAQQQFQPRQPPHPQPQPHFFQPPPPPPLPEPFPQAAVWQLSSPIPPDQAQWLPQAPIGGSVASACARLGVSPPHEPSSMSGGLQASASGSGAIFQAGAPNSATPTAPAAISAAPAAGTADRRVLLRIEGMHCEGCASGVTRALQALPRVTAASVDCPAGTATVLCLPPVPSGDSSPLANPVAEPLIAAVEALGFSATLQSDEPAHPVAPPGPPGWGEAGPPGPAAPPHNEAEVLFLRRRVEQLESQLASFGISAQPPEGF